MSLFRFFQIIWVVFHYRLDEFFSDRFRHPLLWLLMLVGRLRPPAVAQRGVRLRQALERLGPVFVKFGQMLSTRPDIIPPDVAAGLAELQDKVTPIRFEAVRQTIEQSFGQPLDRIFAEFDRQPIAAASVAQVHFARLPADVGGDQVAVKILRPDIAPVMKKDMALLNIFAALLAYFSSDGERLRPREVVKEFSRHLYDELDLRKEAANCAQLGRNFSQSTQLIVPHVYWDYCHKDVMVMQRIYGTPVSQIDKLRQQGIDLSKLSAMGVEIFFTQVFRDGFFHADMHPGNIFVSEDGRYIAVDFGIVGQLTTGDKSYLAQNFLAFFQRDYRKVAEVHISCGWAPADTPLGEFESAIRTVCEPIFEKPLKDISFGKILLQLFQTSRQFNIHVQPQLMMLQKTLLNIEGLGRQLDPQLDLWKTAKPFLEKWMQQQIGWRGLLKQIKSEASLWSQQFPELPRLLHHKLSQQEVISQQLDRLVESQQNTNRLVKLLIILLCGLAAWLIHKSLFS